MPSPQSWHHGRAARAERATGRDDDAAGRDADAAARDTAAQARDDAAAGRDEQLLDLELRLRRLLTDAERRHAAEDARLEALAGEHAPADDRTGEQADIDRETRRTERELDAADLAAVRAGLDWLHDTYLRGGRRDRTDAADDRTIGQADRTAAAADRDAAEADREQSAVDDAQHD